MFLSVPHYNGYMYFFSSLLSSDLDYWLQETEAKLSSDDLGRDIDGVEALAKKHQLLEAELLAQQVTNNIHVHVHFLLLCYWYTV